MPQLDISTYASQLFWLFVSLSILLGFMHWVIVPRYLKLTHEREKAMKENLRDAENAETEANHLENALVEMKEKAKRDTRKLIANERHALSEENIEAREKIFAHERTRLRFELKRIAEEDAQLTEERPTISKDLAEQIKKNWGK